MDDDFTEISIHVSKFLVNLTFIPVIMKQNLYGWVPGLILLEVATLEIIILRLFWSEERNIDAHILFFCSAVANFKVSHKNKLKFVALYFFLLAVFNGLALVAWIS